MEKLSRSVEELTGWEEDYDPFLPSMSELILETVRDYVDGVPLEELAWFQDDTGKVVWFNGAVSGKIKEEINGEIGTKNVLILVTINNWLARKDVDLNACITEEEREECLATQARRYKEAYDGLMEEWEKNATGERKRRLEKRLNEFRWLKSNNAELKFAIGSSNFPKKMKTFCKQQGYLCVVPKGREGKEWEVCSEMK